MEDTKFVVCRLCLKIVRDLNFKLLENIELSMLDMLAPMNMCISSGSAVCNACHENLLVGYGFKANCIEVDDRKKSLEENGLYFGDREPTNAKLCSLCLQHIDAEMLMEISLGVKDTLVSIMLEKCLPELDVHQIHMAACSKCFKSLEKMFTFINECQITEEKIDKFCTTKNLNKQHELRLLDVVMFLQPHSMNIDRPRLDSLTPLNYTDSISTNSILMSNFKSEPDQDADRNVETTINDYVNINSEAPQISNMISPRQSKLNSLNVFSHADVKLEPAEDIHEFIGSNNEDCLSIGPESCDSHINNTGRTQIQYNTKVTKDTHSLPSSSGNFIAPCREFERNNEHVERNYQSMGDMEDGYLSALAMPDASKLSQSLRGLQGSSDLDGGPDKKKRKTDHNPFKLNLTSLKYDKVNMDFDKNKREDEDRRVRSGQASRKETRSRDVNDDPYEKRRKYTHATTTKPPNKDGKSESSHRPRFKQGLSEDNNVKHKRSSRDDKEIMEGSTSKDRKSESNHRPRSKQGVSEDNNVKHKKSSRDDKEMIEGSTTKDRKSESNHRPRSKRGASEDNNVKHKKRSRDDKEIIEGSINKDRKSESNQRPGSKQGVSEGNNVKHRKRSRDDKEIEEGSAKRTAKHHSKEKGNGDRPKESRYKSLEELRAAGDPNEWTPALLQQLEQSALLPKPSCDIANQKSQSTADDRESVGAQVSSVKSILEQLKNKPEPVRHRLSRAVTLINKRRRKRIIKRLVSKSQICVAPYHRCPLGRHGGFCAATIGLAEQLRVSQYPWGSKLRQRLSVFFSDGNNYTTQKELEFITVTGELVKVRVSPCDLRLNRENFREKDGMNMKFFNNGCWKELIATGSECMIWLAEQLLATPEPKDWSLILRQRLATLFPKDCPDNKWVKGTITALTGKMVLFTISREMLRLENTRYEGNAERLIKESSSIALSEAKIAPLHQCKLGPHKGFCAATIGVAEQLRNWYPEIGSPVLSQRLAIFLPEGSHYYRRQMPGYSFCTVSDERLQININPNNLSLRGINVDFFKDKSWDELTRSVLRQVDVHTQTNHDKAINTMRDIPLPPATPQNFLQLISRSATDWLIDQLLATSKPTDWSPLLRQRLATLIPASHPDDEWLVPRLTSPTGKALYVRICREMLRVQSNNELASSSSLSASQDLSAQPISTGNAERPSLNEVQVAPFHQCKLGAHKGFCALTIGMAEQLRNRDPVMMSPALSQRLAIFLPAGSRIYTRRKPRYTFYTASGERVFIRFHLKSLNLRGMNEDFFKDKSWDELTGSVLRPVDVHTQTNHEKVINTLEDIPLAPATPLDLLRSISRIATNWLVEQLLATSKPTDWSPILRQRLATLIPASYPDDEWIMPQLTSDIRKYLYVRICREMLRVETNHEISKSFDENISSTKYELSLNSSSASQDIPAQPISTGNAETPIKESTSTSLNEVKVAPFHQCKLGFHKGFCAATIGVAEQLRNRDSVTISPTLSQRLAIFFSEGSHGYTCRKHRCTFYTVSGERFSIRTHPKILSLRGMNEDFFKDKSWDELTRSTLRPVDVHAQANHEEVINTMEDIPSAPATPLDLLPLMNRSATDWLLEQLLATPKPTHWSPILRQRLATLIPASYPDDEWLIPRLASPTGKYLYVRICREMLEVQSSQEIRLHFEENICSIKHGLASNSSLSASQDLPAQTISSGNADERPIKECSSTALNKVRIAPFHQCKLGPHNGFCAATIGLAEQLRNAYHETRSPVLSQRLAVFFPEGAFYSKNQRHRFCTVSGNRFWSSFNLNSLCLGDMNEDFFKDKSWDELISSVLKLRHIDLPSATPLDSLSLISRSATDWLVEQLRATSEPTDWSPILRQRLASLIPANYPDDRWLIPLLMSTTTKKFYVRICREMLRVQSNQEISKHFKENTSSIKCELASNSRISSSQDLSAQPTDSGNAERPIKENSSTSLNEVKIAPIHQCRLGPHNGFCAATIGLAEQLRNSYHETRSPVLNQRLAIFFPEGAFYNKHQRHRFCTVSGIRFWSSFNLNSLRLGGMNEDFFKDKSWDELISSVLQLRHIDLPSATALDSLSLISRSAKDWLVEQLLITSEPRSWRPLLRQRLATLIPASFPNDKWLIPQLTSTTTKSFCVRICRKMLRVRSKQEISKHFEENISSIKYELASNSGLSSSQDLSAQPIDAGNYKRSIKDGSTLSETYIASLHQCKLGHHRGFCAATIGLAEQLRNSSHETRSPVLNQRLAIFFPEGAFYIKKQRFYFWPVSGDRFRTTIHLDSLCLGGMNEDFFRHKSWDELTSSVLRLKQMYLPSLISRSAIDWLVEQLLATSKPTDWSPILRQRLATLIPVNYPDEAWLIPQLTSSAGKYVYVRICREMLKLEIGQEIAEHHEEHNFNVKLELVDDSYDMDIVKHELNP